MRFRITIVLMIAIGGLTAIAVGTVLFISASASIRNTLELMRTQARLTIALVERGVFDHVAPARNLIADISGQIARSALDINDRERLATVLSGALAPVPQIGGVVVWRPDGRALWVTRRASGGIAVDEASGEEVPGFETFIAEVAEAQGIRWGAPFYREGSTFITMTGVVVRGGGYGGIVATGVSLVDLSRFVRDLAEEGMTAFVLYGDDKVLAHPAMLDSEYSGRLSAEKPLLSIGEVGDPVLARFAELPVAELPGGNEFQVRETGDRGEGHIILSKSSNAFGPVPWQIGVHVPVAEVDEQFERLVVSIVISLGMLVVAVALSLVLARRIARPIRAVSAAAERIERLDLDAIEPLPHSRIRELDEQARSFNRMVQGLRWFQTYVPQTLVRRLMHAGGGPAAHVREAELTVMFTDIVGFTPLSETMPPADLAEMLNRHFAMLNGCIEAEAGTLDKYVGDAAMAFWGAPEPIPDHAARACRAALAIAEAMSAREAAGETPPLRVKVAIHTGPLIVGNIGAPSRMNYTVIGDTVNVCARIETLAGEFVGSRAATILVSGDVVAAAGADFVFEPIGDHTVRGRTRSVEIWRLLRAA
ncbi:MAG: adenylate/guanylate cyclase domain-containing protein [Propylenella sp.]